MYAYTYMQICMYNHIYIYIYEGEANLARGGGLVHLLELGFALFSVRPFPLDFILLLVEGEGFRFECFGGSWLRVEGLGLGV